VAVLSQRGHRLRRYRRSVDELYFGGHGAFRVQAAGGGRSQVFDARLREELQKKASVVISPDVR
jgi:hypothetical protein